MIKKILLQSFMLYILSAACTGSIYRLYEPKPTDHIAALILTNITMMTLAFVISYFGFKTAVKKGHIKKDN